MNRKPESDAEQHLSRVRRICLSMPEATEKLSHGEPTFFARKKVFAMFSEQPSQRRAHRCLIPAAPGQQAALIATSPATYYRPPYVGRERMGRD
jgi:hypothetical protein